MKTAYLHFGGAFTGTQEGPFLTIKTEARENLLPWQKRGLSYTATGYGRKIPSTWQVKFEGTWRRVYICCFSNSGTAYITSKGKPLARVDLD
jgi:hypothetical protein